VRGLPQQPAGAHPTAHRREAVADASSFFGGLAEAARQMKNNLFPEVNKRVITGILLVDEGVRANEEQSGISDFFGFEIRGVLKNQGGYSTDMMTRGPGGVLNNQGGFSTLFTCGHMLEWHDVQTTVFSAKSCSHRDNLGGSGRAMNPSATKRRWLQFNLQRFIALITVVCILFAWVSVKVRQTQIDKIVAECGATTSPFYPPYENWGPPGIAVFFDSPQTTDKELRCLKVLSQVQHLWLTETSITDRGMHEVGDLRDLRALFLIRTNIADRGLRELRELRELRALHLAYTKVTDAGLQDLREMEKLELLGLTGTDVTDKGLDALAQHKSLRYLDVAKTKVSDAGIDKLQEILPNLRIERRSLDELPPTP
jgi:hypothetical protein